ncbi:MAG: hypothetical protein QOH37_517 [Nocardioidaceae bacterium]|nr:hypothetical protein [Nocardioidaceae bacterium]
MTDKLVLTPGPDHPITITPADTTVTVHFGDRLIASTDRALVLQEASYPPVYYLPLDAVEADVLEATTHETYCPYKGDASYYSLHNGGALAENAVWAYVAPYDAVSPIAGHVAFYPDRVTISAA